MVQGTMRRDLYPELYRMEEQHWWHRQKRRVIHALIKKYCPRPGRVLDVGCGSGKILAELQTLGWQIEGVDAPDAKAQSQRRNLKIKTVNLQTRPLPFPKNYFDLVLCLDTLEHMSDDQRLAAEMSRVAKPGGNLIISVPAYQWLFSYWDKMLGHFRRYNEKTLVRSIRGSNLKTQFISYFFSFLLLPAIFVRLLKAITRQKKQSDFATDPVPVFSHSVVNLLGSLELIWLKKFRLPLGLSLIGIFQKR